MSKSRKPTGSLRDQLLQAGLVTTKQAKKAEKAAQRQDLRVRKGVEVDQDRLAVEQVRLAKLERDREINAELHRKAQQKALRAQVRQLIASNSKRLAGDIAYNFTDDNKVKTIYISAVNKSELNKGYLAIVRTDEGYDLVPEPVATKIRQRQADAVVYLYDRSADVMDEDDPYKDYPIPDDLEW
ncbi:MAG: DUF2058 domain-containing protein [Pseudomonadota bacterium]